MEAALEVRNGDNIIQIDSMYRNYYCSSKGTVRITYANDDLNPNPAFPEGILYVNGINPVVAINAPRNIRSWRDNIGPNQWRFRFTVDDYLDRTQGRDFLAECYVFDRPVPGPGNLGMQLFDAGGGLVYDSSHECMRVIGAINYSGTFPFIGYKETDYRFGNGKVAILTCQQAMKTLPTEIFVGGGEGTVPGFEFYTVTCRTVGATITVLDSMRASQIGSLVAFIDRPQAYFLVIDVDGML